MKRLSIFLCLITLAVVFMGHKVLAQTSFSIPPKSYPVNVPFKCDAGVDRYWHVTSIICTGQANGGYKFQIKGMAQKTSRSQPIDLFYLMPGNRIKTAGTYYFPRIEEGKPFSFEVVSAFSGYAPAKFNGFFISSEVLQRLLQQELREPKEAGKNASERRFGMPKATSNEEPQQKPVQPKVSPNKIYKSSEVDQKPEYPGGAGALQSDIARSIRYPMVCKQQKIQGNVLVSFIVEKDGSVSDVTAVKKVHANLNTEAIRVVKSLKKWTPGTKDGQPVRVQSAVYVTFSL